MKEGNTKDVQILTPPEEAIMSLIWEQTGNYTEVGKIGEKLKDKYQFNYARTTISTYLGRLAEKGFIKRVMISGRSYVLPVVTMETYLQNILKRELKLWFHDDKEKLIAFVKTLEN